jgi:hypothetical protein
MRYLGLAILTAVLVTGCAEKHWTKPGATLEDFNRDSSACGLEARRGVNIGMPVNKRAYRYCMRDRGYRQVEGGEWVGLRD